MAHHTLAVAALAVAAAFSSTATAAAQSQTTSRDAYSVLVADVVITEDYPLGDPRLADYPACSGGTSGGYLTAAQRGEPIGAGGTSGGYLSPFAIATAR